MGLVSTGEEYTSLRYIEKASSLIISVEQAGKCEHPRLQNLVTNAFFRN